MDSHVNPQPTDAHIRISHDIHRELIRRKFTQYQRVIIDFILTLSWGCGKASAVIPKIKYFEQCGIRKQHIKTELLKLVEKQVVIWDEDLNVFQINKHFDQWKIDQNDLFDPKLMSELIKKNIDTHTPNLRKKVTDNVTKLQNPLPVKVTESGTELRNVLLKSNRIRNRKVTKSVTIRRDFLNIDKPFRSSKAIIKAIKKKRTTTTTTSGVKDDYSFGNVFRQYHINFLGGGQVTQFDSDEFQIQYDDYGGEWLLKAMREAYKQGKDKRNLAYVHGVLKGYKERGGPEAPETRGKTIPITPFINRNQQRRNDAAELRRQAKEERQRGPS